MKYTNQQRNVHRHESQVPEAISGLRMTRARRGIIHILGSSEVPMAVEEVLTALRRSDQRVVLSTVYRNLDSLTAHGAVRRLLLADGDRALFELASGPHRHYAVCLKCHLVVPLGGCPVEEFVRDTGKRLDFDVTDHDLVLYGYCHNCKSGEESGHKRQTAD
jgi:Fur family ferric uptake transcriptional regulator